MRSLEVIELDEIETIMNSAGRIHGYVQLKKLSDFKPTGKCLNCGGELPKMCKKYCSDKCSYDFWVREIRPFTIDWSIIRNDVIERDNHRCVECGSDYNLEVHHIKPIKDGGNNSLRNLQTLCEDCHNNQHNKIAEIKRKTIPLKTFINEKSVKS
jgi:hypothetical protein